MAAGFTQDELVNVGGVLAILIGVIVVNNLMSTRLARKPAPTIPDGPPFIGKYAQHEGSVVGKVVAIEGDHLVIEQGGVRRNVPVAQARDEGHDVILVGDIGKAP